ncbi:LysR family transcriptional regulator [Methylobacterium radiodurans]|uniref:LysR family transcriptional regulator n=1 Tax=Methylobacterium radiodurans TaxID=2202828 RepID=A0A2U8W1P8_9HYPH|nr:LysR family transcriptional regulator [Methylobacterium radiodurans]AWN39196.1 LysR family transcriptional regulator [Methylobacterium radiodurans]
MLTTDDLRFFAAIVCAPSLAAAARDLNVSAPAVTQRLRALEERLGAHLIVRAGRQLTLTDEGELLAERGRRVLAELNDLDEALAERQGHVSGHLRIIAPLGFGRRHVAPVVAAFQEAHPRIKIDLALSDRIGGVPSSTWDIAVHVGEIQAATPSLIVRGLAPNERWVCAAPSYLARQGAPTDPHDLRTHSCIALRENDEDVTLWRFRSIDSGAEERVRVAPSLASNDGEVARIWAIAGRGIVMRSEWDVADDIRGGRLVRLLKNHTLPSAPIVVLLSARQEARAARIGRFIDALKQTLDPTPWRNMVTDVPCMSVAAPQCR